MKEKKPLWINIKLTLFQTANNLTLPLNMTSKMVESAWANVVFFSPPSQPGNTKNIQKNSQRMNNNNENNNDNTRYDDPTCSWYG